jgi:hypothetical protein
MAYKPPLAIYYACVLHPFHLRNLLVRCAVERLVEARWRDGIHDEWIRSVAANDPGISIDRLNVTHHLMNAVLPDAMVSNYENHIPAINLPDLDDRHVVAAAIVARASLIITWNVRDFPAKELAKASASQTDPRRPTDDPLRCRTGRSRGRDGKCQTKSSQVENFSNGVQRGQRKIDNRESTS